MDKRHIYTDEVLNIIAFVGVILSALILGTVLAGAVWVVINCF